MKGICKFFPAVAALLLSTAIRAAIVQGGGMNITVSGKPGATIVKPSDATPREAFAAEELQKYIQKISGATLQIKPDSARVTGNMILIGGPARNKKTASMISEAAFDAAVPGPEGMMIKTFGSNVLVLAGSSKKPREYERGTLYAVYEFLEADIGCSFAAYGKPGMDMGEYVPGISTIKIGTVEHIKSKADLSYRTAIVQYFRNTPHDHGLSIAFIDWLAKNRYNRINTMASVYEDFKTNGLLDEAKKRGILFTVGHHESSMLFLPPGGNSYFPEHYYTTHPEYYKLRADSTRYYPKNIWSGQWVFDSRCEEAISQMADNIKIWLSRNPYVDIVCLWPCDGTDSQCTCTKCSAYSKTENYAYFVNKVARKVNAGYPDTKIDMLVYKDIWTHPDGLVLDASLVIDQANITRFYGKNDGTSLLGTACEDNAKSWASGGATVVYYEYYMGKFRANQVYLPMADELQSVYNYFKTNGYCKGVGTQIECHNLWNHLLNFYVHGRASYNTSLTLNDNLSRFCKIFGAGAPYIRAYLKYVEGFYEGQQSRSPEKWFIENVNKATVYDYFEKAYNAVPEGALRNNIRMLRMAFRYSDLYVNGAGSGELKYMYENFDSHAHDPGYGISVWSTGAGDFMPDKWYKIY